MFKTADLDYLTRINRADYLSAIKRDDLKKAREIIDSGLDLKTQASSFLSDVTPVLRDHLRDHNHNIVEHFIDVFPRTEFSHYHASSLCTAAIENQAYSIAHKIIDHISMTDSTLNSMMQAMAAQKHSKSLQELIDKLQEIDSEGVDPRRSVCDMHQRFREDKVENTNISEDLFKNVPDSGSQIAQEVKCFVVPKVIE